MRKAAALALTLVASAALAGGPSDDALSLVPADAASVGLIRVADLRGNPMFAKVFAETDRITVDGDAARFLAETRLDPKADIDLVVVAGSPKSATGGDGNGLVLMEGRFEAERLATALQARGARPATSPAGTYYLLPKNTKDGVASVETEGAVAFPSRHLAVAGSEAAVRRALADRAAGGTGFASGSGLGRHLARVDSGASAFVLVDAQRFPQVKDAASKVNVKAEGEAGSVAAVVGAMKDVSLFALSATAKGDALSLSATGVVSDAETRDLMEDAIRGVLAALRLAAQDKNPDAVAVLRRFKVGQDRDAVTVSGTIPGAAIRALAERDRKTASR